MCCHGIQALVVPCGAECVGQQQPDTHTHATHQSRACHRVCGCLMERRMEVLVWGPRGQKQSLPIPVVSVDILHNMGRMGAERLRGREGDSEEKLPLSLSLFLPTQWGQRDR